MKMNVRKWLSAVLAVTLVAVMIPIGGISVSAAVNMISNGTFETGTGGWGKSTNTVMTIEAGIVGNSLKATHGDDWAYVYTNAKNLTTNTDYIVSFKSKVSVGKFNINFSDTGWNSVAGKVPSIPVSPTTEWAEYSFEFNSSDYTSLLLFFQSNQPATSAQTIWLDDVKVTAKTAEDSRIPDMPITAVYADGFENGKGAWAASDGSLEVVTDDQLPVSNGTEHALKHTITNGSYPYMSDKTAFTVEPNTDYILSFSSLATDYGWPVKAIIGTNYWLDSVVYETASVKPDNTKWTTYSYVFNSGNNTRLYMGLKSTWTNTTVYFDNVSVTRIFDDGHIRNGDFDTGSTMEWVVNDGVDVDVDPTGFTQGYVMNSNITAGSTTMFSQAAKNMTANTDYKLRFRVYGYTTAVNNAAFWVRFSDTVTDWSVNVGSTGLTSQKVDDNTPRINVNTKLNTWHTVIITFNTGNATEVLINFMNYRTDGGQYYFDDLIIYEAKDPSDDGYIINGDFEIGAEPVWELHAQSYIDTPSAHDGNFGAHLKVASAGWGGTLSQTVNNLQVGATYRITFWYKTVQQGLNWKVEGETLKEDGRPVSLAYGYITNKSWTKVSKVFVADGATARISFSGSGLTESDPTYEAGIDEMYVDSFLIELIPDNVNDLFSFSGTSAREEVPATATSAGLGFLFRVNMKDAKTNWQTTANGQSFGNIYQSGSATAYPYTNPESGFSETYSVVEVGALMSFNPDATADGLTMADVDENKTTIKIAGEKRWTNGDTDPDNGYSYAVRIVNIPNNHHGTTIFARPYVILQAGDRIVTLYGDMQQSSYAAHFE